MSTNHDGAAAEIPSRRRALQVVAPAVAATGLLALSTRDKRERDKDRNRKRDRERNRGRDREREQEPSPEATQPAVVVAPPAPSSPGLLQLYVNEGYLKMVDGSMVYHRGFADQPTAPGDPQPRLYLTPQVITAANDVIASRTYPLNAALPLAGRPVPASADAAHPGEYLVQREHWASYFPDRTIIAETGATVRIRLHNRLSQPHELAFSSAGAQGEDLTTGPIAPGAIGELEFAAPPPGCYIYSDPTNAPVERVLGLFGVLVVIDPADQWCVMNGGAEFERQWIWICHDIEPAWAAIAAAGGTVNPRMMKAVPRYFTLNGKAGYESLGITRDAAANLRREEDTLMSGSARHVDVRNFSAGYSAATISTGQLIRLVNPGIVFHQMHFHGNHLWTVRRNGHDFPRTGGYVDSGGHVVLQQWEDVVELEPMDRKECIIPLKRPPDSTDAVWNNRYSDWHYPMHCHAEPSQTAAGGMYPGGLVAHWSLAAPATGEL